MISKAFWFVSNTTKSIACVQTSPLPQKKLGEETLLFSLLPIFSEGGGTSVHRLPRVGYSLWSLLKLERQRCTHVSIFSDFIIKRFKTSRNFTENKSYIGPQNGVGIPDGRSSSVKMHLACQMKTLKQSRCIIRICTYTW